MLLVLLLLGATKTRCTRLPITGTHTATNQSEARPESPITCGDHSSGYTHGTNGSSSQEKEGTIHRTPTNAASLLLLSIQPDLPGACLASPEKQHNLEEDPPHRWRLEGTREKTGTLLLYNYTWYTIESKNTEIKCGVCTALFW